MQEVTYGTREYGRRDHASKHEFKPYLTINTKNQHAKTNSYLFLPERLRPEV